ncbi:MAG: Cro/Cl family transcriptional regulator [Gammaproteobacteria bacterium]|jgi:DNA-binding transcriptional regulator YdaS (Cro superfamily)|nr:Cro/Cl family transcriptional regulator [Gammaproteobacteria bacterium]
MNTLKKYFPTQRSLAKAINVTPQAVNQWFHQAKVPVKRAVEIERLTDGAISRRDLRPDIFE